METKHIEQKERHVFAKLDLEYLAPFLEELFNLKNIQATIEEDKISIRLDNIGKINMEALAKELAMISNETAVPICAIISDKEKDIFQENDFDILDRKAWHFPTPMDNRRQYKTPEERLNGETAWGRMELLTSIKTAGPNFFKSRKPWYEGDRAPMQDKKAYRAFVHERQIKMQYEEAVYVLKDINMPFWEMLSKDQKDIIEKCNKEEDTLDFSMLLANPDKKQKPFTP